MRLYECEAVSPSDCVRPIAFKWSRPSAPAPRLSGGWALTTGSNDAVIVTTLQPGLYSAILSGANGTSGAAMVEVYEIP
jgi:hypothetical protein